MQRVWFFGAVLVLLVGCGGTSQQSEVSGTVTLDGRAIGPGMVVFAPMAGSQPATGAIAADGGYYLKTSREIGLAAGRYRASVSVRELPANLKPGDRPPPGKLLIPEKYELSTTSGLEFEVAPGKNRIDIELTGGTSATP
jgi:hypothetical protein